MKKNFLSILFLIGLCSSAFSQEVLAPLSAAPAPAVAKSNDTLVLELPFFDDFADYDGQPDSKRWLGAQAFVNKDYAPQPPSLGVATLDALDADGNLYVHASTNIFSADTLASQIVRLDSLTGTYQRRLQPSDSIYLSFFYLPGGWYGPQWELVGDAPSSEDSLFLDFYNAAEQQWEVVWATAGSNADTAATTSHWPWRFVNICIDDPRFFNKDFRFRFRNYASLDPNPKSGIAGNCDHWNIDYVYLNRNRNANDSTSRDVAFVDKAGSMLEKYQAMPARQYRTSDMAANLNMRIANRYNQTLASHYTYAIYDDEGQQVAQYDGGFENIAPFFPNGLYQDMAVHCNPPVNYAFPESATPSAFDIVHIVREGVGGDLHNGNDTTRFRQVFDNYYAYDDGVPENGYGLTSSSSRMWLAYRFDLRVQDTLTAVDICFNRTRNGENEEAFFQLCVWSASNGKPSTMIYKDAERMHPLFNGRNGLYRYPLSTPLVVGDTIFVGFEQLSNDYINIGFDRSTDSRRFTFYRTGNEWMQSILRGSVMMRPVFGTSAIAAIDNQPDKTDFAIFPNPAVNIVNIRTNLQNQSNASLSIIDICGRTVLDVPFSDRIDISALQNGIYFLRLADKSTGMQVYHKLIIKR